MTTSRSALELLDDILAELNVLVQPVRMTHTSIPNINAPINLEKSKKSSSHSTHLNDSSTSSSSSLSSSSSSSSSPTTTKLVTTNNLTINSIDLRVGKIVKVEKHASAEKLYVEEIDVGEEVPRPIASGLVPYYSLEQMQNRNVIVICNLKPRNLVGFKSHGMVLCAATTTEDEQERVEFVDPPSDSKPGDRIIGEGLLGEPLTPNQVDKQKAFDIVATSLRVNEDGIAMWGNIRLVTSSGAVCTVPTIRNGILR